MPAVVARDVLVLGLDVPAIPVADSSVSVVALAVAAVVPTEFVVFVAEVEIGEAAGLTLKSLALAGRA